jgi:formiminotetrahydrofolate cyclodeaminase
MLSEQQVGEFLAALGERTPTPASGAATALTGALAGALTELAARFAEDDDAVMRAKALTVRLLQLADEDGAAYTAFMADKNDETRARIIAGAGDRSERGGGRSPRRGSSLAAALERRGRRGSGRRAGTGGGG